ncbi:hypothetical protein A2Z22_04480 [Candidatus Woesebacteria bacterium RBG_16_34_12]|uniref:Uncharacterized protein n=1 Tax=Candidatus Woesebacteria bacterium RBG_16_34_12 TaxID=1802480 RepID=A0A1F7XBM2_9BACT|nr:MAG: hypothetical protein A2Z22_04480 [Candidatus Woesebacteria bacterium RBG_16_34_12]
MTQEGAEPGTTTPGLEPTPETGIVDVEPKPVNTQIPEKNIEIKLQRPEKNELTSILFDPDKFKNLTDKEKVEIPGLYLKKIVTIHNDLSETLAAILAQQQKNLKTGESVGKPGQFENASSVEEKHPEYKIPESPSGTE